MKTQLVTMHCGWQNPDASSTQRHCNRQCSGYFSRNLLSNRWKIKRKRQEKPYIPSSSPLWDKASHHTTKDGYIQLRVYDATTRQLYQRMEHIVTWERHHGSRVPDGCIIHHRDENRENNRVDNLLCMSRAAHTEMHAELKRLKMTITPDEYLDHRENIMLKYQSEVFVPGPRHC
ncbi:HNH endonuclease [Geobacter hydrogenophilus]|uniref:HNH nuclease domain-containing protein n=1 Tax=Geobacter hydrogenophilus TaxID=40983 RepID=A0A9W6G1N3_9BACT|nr:HNH endonuclease signature motif containing protein [Geobacter hydrogenophilus]MBT0895428.1 HNH endonuclease [Geobacter hydrogenophilus]GLI38782.1 hypothetical protein GHYDROH2_22830 [Geobacter hydrogenophilus]